ncbi:hypothetical protein M0R45_017284 [Rubus argutus]|uniref:DUF4220 domain-containing protein n=1 Tax=Rubus argutus TaxID=59490 RepID=A0AAW1XXV6_RUBAR
MVQFFPASVFLTSLCLQIVLIVFGNRRKYIARNWIGIVTWMAYLSADWVATVALGMISNFQGVDDDQQNTPHPNTLIMASWAPFLLVHLGGPDTITAYSQRTMNFG